MTVSIHLQATAYTLTTEILKTQTYHNSILRADILSFHMQQPCIIAETLVKRIP